MAMDYCYLKTDLILIFSVDSLFRTLLLLTIVCDHVNFFVEYSLSN